MGNVGIECIKWCIDCFVEKCGLEVFGNLYFVQCGEMVVDVMCVGVFCKVQCFIYIVCVVKFVCGCVEMVGVGVQCLWYCGEVDSELLLVVIGFDDGDVQVVIEVGWVEVFDGEWFWCYVYFVDDVVILVDVDYCVGFGDVLYYWCEVVQ